MTITSFFYEDRQREKRRREINSVSMENVQISGIRVREVFEQFLPCCERPITETQHIAWAAGFLPLEYF
jgi:hypothetical protein